MTQEDKDLLLRDLCARLPYGVKVNAPFTSNKNENSKGYKINGINFGVVEWTPVLFGEKKQRNSIIIEAFSEEYNQYCSIDIELNNDIERVKPYLIPLSSISEELEKFIRWKLTTPKYDSFDEESLEDLLNNNMQIVHYCYEHHLDINGLIERGLALEAPEGMYN